ncbi:hypothetical protein FD754_023811 [Muntiacus muntjak]|uniref:LRAT domain-containing protein n=1 Tax=Muntiacus muntjak TaxID=9888 RepID=A0A5N3US30_MUNMU|nr:hypothetical protein FD754_023816 [Muntiacus muntjak]KAB0339582.1 hypothetical protein FD754_023811 [Muntiacus muntjak]
MAARPQGSYPKPHSSDLDSPAHPLVDVVGNIPGALVASIMSSLVEKAFVKKEQLRDVVGGDKYKVNNKHDDKYKPFKPSKIVQQAEKLVGKEFSYNMFSNNCEHFVNELRYGVPRSDQPTRFLCPWDFPGKNTEGGSISFSRGSSQSRDQTHVS